MAAFILAFFVGLIVGSFLNVCIVRVPKGESVVTPRSHCRACEEPVAWHDNIPVISYIALRGRCRTCGAKFSPRYVLVELLTAVLFTLLVARIASPQLLILYGVFVSALVVIIFIDIDYLIIPDVISLPAILIAPGAAFVFEHLTFRDSIIGILVGGGILWSVAWTYERIRHQEGMGFGDVKLLAMIGGVQGYGGVLFTLFAGAMVGSVVGIAVLVATRGRLDSEIPFGPFLVFGSLLYLFAGPELIGWYFGRVPVF